MQRTASRACWLGSSGQSGNAAANTVSVHLAHAPRDAVAPSLVTVARVDGQFAGVLDHSRTERVGMGVEPVEAVMEGSVEARHEDAAPHRGEARVFCSRIDAKKEVRHGWQRRAQAGPWRP